MPPIPRSPTQGPGWRPSRPGFTAGVYYEEEESFEPWPLMKNAVSDVELTVLFEGSWCKRRTACGTARRRLTP
ncbi:hypothetical protein AB0M92_34500 [Streptomyces sp. NPDC051582]|uniref:hypothetical protein n=1 Tax=Streptomyces sp. NPDC051582 TaxID=3155167 RepID=UPI003449023C